MSRVQKLTGPEAELLRQSVRLLCGTPVRVSDDQTITRRVREDRNRRLGLPSDQCGLKAVWLVDGQPMCLAHAGRAALTILEAA